MKTAETVSFDTPSQARSRSPNCARRTADLHTHGMGEAATPPRFVATAVRRRFPYDCSPSALSGSLGVACSAG